MMQVSRDRVTPPAAFGAPSVIPAATRGPCTFLGCPRQRPGRPAPPQRPGARVWGGAAMAAGGGKKKQRGKTMTVENRVARVRYEFLETFECGVELVGTEVKAVRGGKMNIRQGFGRVKDGELFLHNVHISPWEASSAYFNHDPTRPRRLLLHKRSIRKLAAQQTNPGLTIVPARAYFNARGFLKVEMALARGKNLHDKREDLKRKDDQRTMQRVVKAAINA